MVDNSTFRSGALIVFTFQNQHASKDGATANLTLLYSHYALKSLFIAFLHKKSSLTKLNQLVTSPVTLSKTLNHCFVLWMGRKAVGPMIRRGSPRCSWLWLLNAPWHDVNPYTVLHNWVSDFITFNNLSFCMNVYMLIALSTLLVDTGAL